LTKSLPHIFSDETKPYIWLDNKKSSAYSEVAEKMTNNYKTFID